MSGGVDSAVAALLLKEQGYEVVGLFMHNWEEEEGGVCTSADDWEDARNVADAIDIPIYSVNFAKEYIDRVFNYFLTEYAKGRTPNPDVLCNREIKFDAFKTYAEQLGADIIATGHYCDITHTATASDGSQTTQLLKAADAGKDQTYFLNQVSTAQLNNVLFPLGGMQKSEVRALAEQHRLTAVAKKKDSTGICFIGERKFKTFLMNYLPAQPGKIVDTAGNFIGTHDGLMYYTLGQRRGLRLGGRDGYAPGRWFVIDKNLEKNELVVSCGEDSALFSSKISASGMNFIGGDVSGEFRCAAKTRYRQPDQPCIATFDKTNVTVVFDTPQRAVTPGQYVVFYDNNRCIGGAVIDSAE